MTATSASRIRPFACFVVERSPGTGYHVASAEGDGADEWKERALALLNVLGQPDPNGPEESFLWVDSPSGNYVGVSVTLLPNGEARYHQAWFQTPRVPANRLRSVGLLIVLLPFVFAGGMFTGRTFVAQNQTATPPQTSDSSGSDIEVPSPTNAEPVLSTLKLKEELAPSQLIRAKLKGYLSQEGLKADTSAPVVDERRAVKLIADLDKTPPPQESIRLSNVEVAKLLALLETLDQWATSEPLSETRSTEERQSK